MRSRLALTCALATACATQQGATEHALSEEAPASTSAQEASSDGAHAKALRGCAGGGGRSLPVEGDGPPIFGEAHERAKRSKGWGRGFDDVELPKGFVRVKRLPPPGEEEHLYEHHLRSDDGARRWSHAWGYVSDDEMLEAAVVVRRHEMPQSCPPSLFEHVVLMVEEGASELAPDERRESFPSWFNHVFELTDDKARRVVEWSYVAKGCEHLEVYERFVEVGRDLFELSLFVDGTADDATLADWLARFFDAPLGLPMPPGRRGLGTEGSVR